MLRIRYATVPCHYHEFQYTQLDFAHDYEVDEDCQHHYQKLVTRRYSGGKKKLEIQF